MNLLHIQKSRGVEGVGFRVLIPKGVGITSYGDYPLRVGGKEGGIFIHINKHEIPPTLKD